jgi:hypothetical protein
VSAAHPDDTHVSEDIALRQMCGPPAWSFFCAAWVPPVALGAIALGPPLAGVGTAMTLIGAATAAVVAAGLFRAFKPKTGAIAQPRGSFVFHVNASLAQALGACFLCIVSVFAGIWQAPRAVARSLRAGLEERVKDWERERVADVTAEDAVDKALGRVETELQAIRKHFVAKDSILDWLESYGILSDSPLGIETLERAGLRSPPEGKFPAVKGFYDTRPQFRLRSERKANLAATAGTLLTGAAAKSKVIVDWLERAKLLLGAIDFSLYEPYHGVLGDLKQIITRLREFDESAVNRADPKVVNVWVDMAGVVGRALGTVTDDEAPTLVDLLTTADQGSVNFGVVVLVVKHGNAAKKYQTFRGKERLEGAFENLRKAAASADLAHLSADIAESVEKARKQLLSAIDEHLKQPEKEVKDPYESIRVVQLPQDPYGWDASTLLPEMEITFELAKYEKAKMNGPGGEATTLAGAIRRRWAYYFIEVPKGETLPRIHRKRTKAFESKLAMKPTRAFAETRAGAEVASMLKLYCIQVADEWKRRRDRVQASKRAGEPYPDGPEGAELIRALLSDDQHWAKQEHRPVLNSLLKQADFSARNVDTRRASSSPADINAAVEEVISMVGHFIQTMERVGGRDLKPTENAPDTDHVHADAWFDIFNAGGPSDGFNPVKQLEKILKGVAVRGDFGDRKVRLESINAAYLDELRTLAPVGALERKADYPPAIDPLAPPATPGMAIPPD